MRIRTRIVPAANIINELVSDLGAPAAHGVFVHGRARRVKNRVDDGPRRLDLILACEERGITVERISYQPLVGCLLYTSRCV